MKNISTPALTPGTSPALRLVAISAAVAGAAFVMLLAVRPLTSPDLGYHLAYGDVFLNTGRVVDDASFITPMPTAENALHNDLGPACYYDDSGRYRFVNVNWGSQVAMAVAMAVAKRLGGWTGMGILRLLLVAGILVSQAGILRKLGVSWVWLGPVWLATGMVAYERMQLRPELFGYLTVLVQIYLLCGRVRWRNVIGVVLVQIVAANVHGFWLLNLGVVAAFLVDTALRAGWHKLKHAGHSLPDDLRRRLKLLAITTALAAPSPIVSPAGWRTLLYPFQTLAFVRHYHIAGSTVKEFESRRVLHPWATIGEFFTPFAVGLRHTKATAGYVVLLSLCGLSAIVLLWHRKWAWLAAMGGYVAASLSMRRNIAPMAMVTAPIVAYAGHLLLASWRQRRAKTDNGRAAPLPAWIRAIGVTAVLAVGLVAAWQAYRVTTSQFYVSERREYRFGLGISPLALPIRTAAWLDAHLDRPQPVFCDYNVSSSILYFPKMVTGVPVLTNTWAMPPSRMTQVLALSRGWENLPLIKKWGMNVAVIQVGRETAPIARTLLASRDWALVNADTWYLTFMRRTPENAAVIAKNEITRENFDVAGFIANCRSADPVEPAMALKTGAAMLQHLQWYDHAMAVWRDCLTLRPDFPEAWLNMGTCLAEQGKRLLAAGDDRYLETLKQARKNFHEALSRGDDTLAKQALSRVNNEIGAYLATQGTQSLNAGNASGLQKLREARDCFAEALQYEGDSRPAMQNIASANHAIGTYLTTQGIALLDKGDAAGLAKLYEAKNCFTDAALYDPGYAAARKNLEIVKRYIALYESRGFKAPQSER